MVGVVCRSCAWCITTQQQHHKQAQPIVAQHKGNGGEEELRLVRHSGGATIARSLWAWLCIAHGMAGMPTPPQIKFRCTLARSGY